MVAFAIVSSRLEYCNSVLAGMSTDNLDWLQRVQNSLARVVTETPRRDYVTPVLVGLHWLPVRARITSKVATLIYKICETRQPTKSIGTSRSLQTYMCSSFFLCQSSAGQNSAVSNRCSILSSHSTISLEHLPDNIRLETFRSHLKKHLFDLSHCIVCFLSPCPRIVIFYYIWYVK